MTPLDFLRLVLPDGGYKVLATPAKKGFRHATFSAHGGLADAAAEYDGRVDLYFGLGGLRERKVEEKQADGSIKVRVRIGSNITSLRAFWLDIDVGEGKPYATKREAATALAAFCRTSMLPSPLIVDSGGGLHVYWPLEADVPPGDWKPVAQRLKALTQALSLGADPTRTADVSSVLRVPGTTNLKHGLQRPVKIVKDAAKVLSLATFAGLVAAACEAHGVEAPRERAPVQPAVIEANADLVAGLEDAAPADARKVILGCAQMRRITTKQETASEPEWYAALQVVRLCQNAEKVAHAVSRNHPAYTPDATDNKLAQLAEKGIGPTTCARFASFNAAACQACPHNGKITSPIQLGRVVVSQPTPSVQVAGIEFQLPDPPEPYSRTRRGIVVQLEDEDGTPGEPTVVYPYDLYPVARTFDEFTGRMRTTFRTYQPMRGWYEFEIDNQDLYDSRALPKTLANADLLPSPSRVKMLGDYMVSYTQKLQAVAEATRLFMQMGWRDSDTRFIIGDQLLSPGGTAQKIGVSSATALAAEKLTTRGSLDEWKKIVRPYAAPGMEPYLFAFGAAFGAPLFGFTNYSGAIINMVGPAGCGKSTVLKAINSVYGHPDSLLFSKEDTVRSMYRRIGVLNSLPIAFDEITNIEPMALSDLAYTFSQGRERMRLTAAATERKDAYQWKTLLVSTANSSLHDKLGALKGDSSAEIVRIFEYRISDKSPLDALTAKNLFDQFNEHYGHAGRVYMQYVVDNTAWVRDQLRKMIDLVFKRTNAPSSERFLIATVAANITGLLVAQKCGLVAVDAKALLDWAVAQIDAQRETVTEAVSTPVDQIGMFLNEHIRDTLVVDSSSNGIGIVSVLRKPVGELLCRFEVDLGVMYIDRTKLRKWCSRNHIAYGELKRELTNRFVLLDHDRRRCLGIGTEFATAQTRCWVLDMKTPHMADMKATLVQGAVSDLRERMEKKA